MPRLRPHRLLARAALVLPLVAAAAFGALPVHARTTASISYPMAAGTWKIAPPIGWVGTTPGTVGFARYEGMPTGALTLNDAVAESTVARFSSGTIDFDIKPLAYSDTGIIFRRHGNDSGEIVYLRANPDCPAADDCIQYAPIVHGLMQWDIYPDKEGPAQIAPTGWNHLHLVVTGEKMLVYVNREAEPALAVPRLQGLTTDGGIAFKGPAIYANLVITAGNPSMLADVRALPVAPGTVIHWLVASPSAFDAETPITAAEIPATGAWRAFDAEPSGLVNLSREFGTPHAPSASIGWLKTVVTAATPTRRTIRIGWARQVSVFLNGKPVFSGDNPYYPVEQRLSPNGRLEADNASIALDLRRGRNEIVLAVVNGWRTRAGVQKAGLYGWAAEAHFDDLAGLTLHARLSLD